MDRQLNMDRSQQLCQNFENCCSLRNCRVELKDENLWADFHELQTEMIITKSGRRMFPSLSVQIQGLDPRGHYCISLKMSPAAHCRHKYTVSGGWAPAGAEEAQSALRTYLHPDSPATGEFWMSQPVSFGRMKLTNTPSPPIGHIVLCSMHKYQPQIVISKTSDPRTISWSPCTMVTFPETSFIAVTAYQNEKITQLKIDNNPFAKGFRENGQSKCKRKRISDDEDSIEHKTVKQIKVSSSKKIEDDSLSSVSTRSSVSSTPSPLCKTEFSSAISPSISFTSTPKSESHDDSLSPVLSIPNHHIPFSAKHEWHPITPGISSSFAPAFPESYHANFFPVLRYGSHPPPEYTIRPLWASPIVFKDPFYSYRSFSKIMIPTHNFHTETRLPPQFKAEDLRIHLQEERKPQFTDYSIKAITGCD